MILAPTQVDHPADYTTGSLHTLNSIPRLKVKKAQNRKMLTPCYSLSTCKLKKKTHKLEKMEEKLQESQLAWQDIFNLKRPFTKQESDHR